MVRGVLLDTDILSAIMRNNYNATKKARLYLLEHEQLTFSVITRYEILRGLKSIGANRQIEAFDLLCEESNIVSVTNKIILKASDIYADLNKRGQLIGDADIFIAASALVYGLPVVTNNENHFSRIPDLYIDNWLK